MWMWTEALKIIASSLTNITRSVYIAIQFKLKDRIFVSYWSIKFKYYAQAKKSLSTRAIMRVTSPA